MPRGQWPDRQKQLAHLAQWRAEASGRSAYTQAGRAARAKGGRTRGNSSANLEHLKKFCRNLPKRDAKGRFLPRPKRVMYDEYGEPRRMSVVSFQTNAKRYWNILG